MLHLIGLSAREINENAPVLGEADVNKLRNQTPGQDLCTIPKINPWCIPYSPDEYN